MKKILSSLTLTSLLLPSIVFAIETPVVTSTTLSPERIMPARGASEGGEKMLGRPELRRAEVKSNLQEKKGDLGGKMELRASSSPARLGERASSTKPLGFCQEIDKALAYVDTKEIKLEERKNDSADNRSEKKNENRTEVDTKRAENESKKKSQLEELTKRATTDIQKQALSAFKKTMEEALVTQKAAADSILAAHRTEVDKAVTARKAETEKALALLKSTVETAKLKAKTDCTNGVSGDLVRKDLRTAIEKAQNDFRTSVKNVEKVKDVSESSKEAKKAELQKVEENFRTKMEKARTDLKSALKRATSTPQQ